MMMIMGTLSIIFSMTSSSIYHLYNSMSEKHYIKLLRFDLIGIALQMLICSLICLYIAFHNYQRLGLGFISILIIGMAVNGLL